MLPRGLIFDFDGLLVDTESAIMNAWYQVHAQDGYEPDPKILQSIIGHVDIAVDLWVAYPASFVRSELESRLQVIARHLCEQAPPRDGVLELLAAARAAGMRLAVASNSSHRHVDGHLERRGLRRHFAAVVCREDVPCGKPSPDVYLAALSQLKLEADEVVAFEDSVPGHQAAAAAGLRVVVVPNPSTVHDHFAHATLKLDSLTRCTLPVLASLKKTAAMSASPPFAEAVPSDSPPLRSR